VSQSPVQLRASGGLRAFNPGASPLCTEEIGFYLCLLSRVSPTNSETPSDLIYLADSSGS
jgi:hypothetical protein